ncbi:MAG: hypothetical protein R3F62_01965 [Planctomycetota bacterium]
MDLRRVQNFLNLILSRDWPISSPLSFYTSRSRSWTLTNVFLRLDRHGLRR